MTLKKRLERLEKTHDPSNYVEMILARPDETREQAIARARQGRKHPAEPRIRYIFWMGEVEDDG